MIQINAFFLLRPEHLFGGHKQSGMGREGGRWVSKILPKLRQLAIGRACHEDKSNTNHKEKALWNRLQMP